MAFGLFKKAETADIIFKGGTIITQDPNLPQAEAVACLDGIIIAVGDWEDVEMLEGRNTEVVDLQGGFMLPGFIDTCGQPVYKAFADACLRVSGSDPFEIVLDAIKTYIEERPDSETYFIYGYNEHILDAYEPKEAPAILDTICRDKPVLALGESGAHAWFNSAAMDIVKAAAEEEEVQTVTLPYLLHTLAPFDFEKVQQAVIGLAAEYCEKGFTTVFDCGSPDYLDSIYEDILVAMLQEDMAKQRFFGSLLINRSIEPALVSRKISQKRTNCSELEEYLNFNTLKLLVEPAGERLNIAGELVLALSQEMCDRGFDVHIDAVGKEAVLASLRAMEAVKNAGRTTFLIAHDELLAEEDLADLSLDNNILQTPLAQRRASAPYPFYAADAAQIIEQLTIDAAALLGIDDKLGSIERGKYADFVIFDENPLEAGTLPNFQNLSCAMTVLNGNLVYKRGEDTPAQWQETFSEAGFESE